MVRYIALSCLILIALIACEPINMDENLGQNQWFTVGIESDLMNKDAKLMWYRLDDVDMYRELQIGDATVRCRRSDKTC